jgi:hypothetical protein
MILDEGLLDEKIKDLTRKPQLLAAAFFNI